MNCMLEGKAFRNDALGSETLAANDLFPDRGTGLRHSQIPRGHVHSRSRAELGSTEKPVGGFDGLHPGRSPGWSQGRDPCRPDALQRKPGQRFCSMKCFEMVMSGDGNPAGNFLQSSGSQCCSPAPHLGPLQPSLDPQLCPETAPDITTLTVAKSLIQSAVSGGFLSESYTLKGHRDMKSTECPGDALYETISQWPEFEA
ncbi:unnamed protein product [Eretmochelys imbricata]